jgi:hypothetical protein
MSTRAARVSYLPRALTSAIWRFCWSAARNVISHPLSIQVLIVAAFHLDMREMDESGFGGLPADRIRSIVG